MEDIWNKLSWSLKYRGPAWTLRTLLKHATRQPDPWDDQRPHPFDRQHGVDTSGFIDEANLAAGHANDPYSNAYMGVAPSRFAATLARWLATPPAAPPESCTFIDLGCGKGRPVLLASAMRFQEVVGVELNPALAQIAAVNVERWKHSGHARSPARIVPGDAVAFDLPPGPCLLYLANPFGAIVLRSLLEKLDARALAGQGTIDLLYQTPHHESVFAEFPAFTKLWSQIMPVSRPDAAAARGYGVTDRCNAYRR